MSKGKKGSVPDGLGARGRRLWLSIMTDLEGDQHDVDLVMEACRIVDVIDDLAAAIDADGVTVVGSRGQVVVHPAVQELRQQQLAFSRLVGQLNLDEGEVGAVLTPRQASGKRAAQEKWRKLKEERHGIA